MRDGDRVAGSCVEASLTFHSIAAAPWRNVLCTSRATRERALGFNERMNRQVTENRDFDDRSVSLEDVVGCGVDLKSPGELHVFADSERWDYAHHPRAEGLGRYAPVNTPNIGNLSLDASQSETVLSNSEKDLLRTSSQASAIERAKVGIPLADQLLTSLNRRGSNLSTTSSGASSIISCCDEIWRAPTSQGSKLSKTAPTALAASSTESAPQQTAVSLQCDLDLTLNLSLIASASPPKSPQRCESLVLPKNKGDGISRVEATSASEDSLRGSKRHVHFSSLVTTHSMGSRWT
jgi:hypothetical protein